MKTAREFFDERWENEQKTNPQPAERKDREYMIYLCGWEDGIKHFISEGKTAARPTAQEVEG